MTEFLFGVAVGAFLTYAAINPLLVKGWIDALRVRIGK